jgi:predicted nucleic acid-binding protein
MILDTSYLIALGKGDGEAFSKGEEIAADGEVQWLPSPVVQELEYGVEMSGSEAEKRQTRNACRLYPTIDIDPEVAHRAGQLLARADRGAGGPGESGIDGIDPMIAAVADQLGDSVLTDNVEDFEKLGVGVETY